MSAQKVYLVVDNYNSPGRVYAVFAEEDAAIDFRDHYHADNADVEERTLCYGQQTACSGYIA